MNVLFQTILSEESTGGTHSVFAKPPTQGFGTIRSFTRRLTRKSSASSSGPGGGGGASDSAYSDASPQTSPVKSLRPKTFSSMTKPRPSTSTSFASTIASEKKKLEFSINWEGTKIDYEFSSKKAVAGILMLEVKQAMDLPRVKNCKSFSRSFSGGVKKSELTVLFGISPEHGLGNGRFLTDDAWFGSLSYQSRST